MRVSLLRGLTFRILSIQMAHKELESIWSVFSGCIQLTS